MLQPLTQQTMWGCLSQVIKINDYDRDPSVFLQLIAVLAVNICTYIVSIDLQFNVLIKLIITVMIKKTKI
jgi:hypothetical protein